MKFRAIFYKMDVVYLGELSGWEKRGQRTTINKAFGNNNYNEILPATH